jgi:glutamine synthetase
VIDKSATPELAELERSVAAGEIDTVVVAATDMQGRLQGKRLDARFFLDDVATHATEACSYLLAVDIDMNTVGGYAMSSWETGYGDFVMTPQLSSLRVLPWQEKTAFCIADLSWPDGTPVAASPRQILARQVDRLAERGWTGLAGTELEFIVFKDSYDEALKKGYRHLEPGNLYNVDYSILGTGRLEPLLGRIRREMAASGMTVESVKGECNLGQHEVAFKYSGLLDKADEHVLYKTGAKEIAAQEGCSLTFMAKFDEKEGNSCHIHLSLRDEKGAPVFAGDGPHGMSQSFASFLGGLVASLPELTLFLAPNVNSYKRFAAGSFAPTGVAWGVDNRTCAFRVVGHGPSLRVECRVPGGDVNPYLALAALVAGGLAGVENGLQLPPEFKGNAYEADLVRIPSSLSQAARLLEESELARAAFSDEVVEHYLNMARVELAAFERTVTDWERFRCFERF